MTEEKELVPFKDESLLFFQYRVVSLETIYMNSTKPDSVCSVFIELGGKWGGISEGLMWGCSIEREEETGIIPFQLSP